jgi:hypothetical protein
MSNAVIFSPELYTSTLQKFQALLVSKYLYLYGA